MRGSYEPPIDVILLRAMYRLPRIFRLPRKVWQALKTAMHLALACDKLEA